MGRRPGDGRAGCTTWACARWAIWLRCRRTPWCAGSGKASGAHLAALARGEDPEPVTPEPAGQVDRARGDVQPGPRGPRRARAPCPAHGRIGGDHAARRVDAARTVTVKVKFRDLSLQTRSHTLGRPIATGGAIGQVAAALLAGIDPGEGVRLLGVERVGAGRRRRRISFPSTSATARRGQRERHGASSSPGTT